MQYNCWQLILLVCIYFSCSLCCEVSITFFIADTRKLIAFAGANTQYKQNPVGHNVLDHTMQKSVPYAAVTCQLDFQ
jgi:hypothetical protein